MSTKNTVRILTGIVLIVTFEEPLLKIKHFKFG